MALLLVMTSAVYGRGGNNGTVCHQLGPDLICGDIPLTLNYLSEEIGGVRYDAFSFSHTMCNIGNENLPSWGFPQNTHEAVVQNLFKLKEGRLVQLGASWLFHGFTALTENGCGCGCNGMGGTVLGAGCSNPYGAQSSGIQNGLTPRWQVNPHTQYFPPGPPPSPPFSGTTVRRLRARATDLEPSSANVRFFIERQYIAPGETAGLNDNNASYRPINMTVTSGEFSTSLTSTTRREKFGIQAWKEFDPSVTETFVHAPNEGLYIVAARATELGNGWWHYEYAVHNANSDLSVRAFSIPMPADVPIANLGFHDVEYHGGDSQDNYTDPNLNFSNEDWTPSNLAGALTWSTQTYEDNVNANALRWGTMYNFWFDCKRMPASGNATLTQFKLPGAFHTPTIVPRPSCDADVAPVLGDWHVNVADLLAVISAWGPCPIAKDCAADVNDDEQVNVADLLAVITAWGACP